MRVSKLVLLSALIVLSSCGVTSKGSHKRSNNQSSTSGATTSGVSSSATSSASSTSHSSPFPTSTSTSTSIPVDIELDDIPVNFTAINDFHGQLDEEEDDYRVGIAKMASYLKDRKAQGDILISSGDNYQGSYLCNVDKGEFVSDVFKYVGFDAYTIGNHEFDWGVDSILANEVALGQKFLGANIYNYPKGSEWTKSSLGEKYRIVKLYEGTKFEVTVGIIGVIGRDQITSITSTFVEDYIFLDPTNIVKDLANELRDEKGCDAVIASYHSDDADTSISNYVDAVFQAHTHKYQKEIVNGVPFLQASAYSRGVSSVSFSFNKNTHTLTLNSANYEYLSQKDLEPETLVANELASLKQSHSSEFNDVIGTNATGGEIDAYDMSKFYAKLSYDRAKSAYSTYDIKGCIFNVSRRELKAGDFTYSDLFETHPFLNDIYILSVSDSNINTQVGWSYGYMDPEFTSTGSSSVYYDVLVFNYNGFHIGVNDYDEKYYNYFSSAFSAGAEHPPVKLSFNCFDTAVDWLTTHHNITTSDFSGSGFFPNY